jgi:hypothetical protein
MRQKDKWHGQETKDKRTKWTNDKEARKAGNKDEPWLEIALVR